MQKLLLVLLAASALFFSCKQDPKTVDPNKLPLESRIDTATGQPLRAGNPWLENACSLLGDDEFQQIFGINPAKDANVRGLKNSGLCLWVWKRPDWKERENANDKGISTLNPESSMALKIISFGLADDAKAIVQAQRAAGAEAVEGLGDVAFWNNDTKTLVVQKGVFGLNLTLEHTDAPHDNLEKAKQVAALILKKVN